MDALIIVIVVLSALIPLICIAVCCARVYWVTQGYYEWTYCTCCCGGTTRVVVYKEPTPEQLELITEQPGKKKKKKNKKSAKVAHHAAI